MSFFSNILRSIFPPARKPVRWVDAWPLFVFLLLFGGIMGTLWTLQLVDFVYPWAFALLLLTPWVWWMQAAGHSGLTAGRGGMAALLRLFIVGLLVAVIAVPQSVRTSNDISVMYAVDVSDSVVDQKDMALMAVTASAAHKPKTDEAGMVVFGGTAAVEAPPRTTNSGLGQMNSRIPRDSTNLQQSLSLSLAMLPEENKGRVVLISDGTETKGELKKAITELQGRNVEVDTIGIQYEYKNEVLLERLDLPRMVRWATPFEASTILTSLQPGKGNLVLEQNGEKIHTEEVEFKAGKNRFAIPLEVNAPGYYEYKARIEVAADQDSRSENNEVENYLYIDGANKILIVHSDTAEPQEYAYVKKALDEAGKEVEVQSAFNLPHDPLSLMPYDVIMFANVPSDELLSSQQQAVHDAVRDLGIGFVMLGGENSFGPGGYRNSPIEDCLPVSMEISKKKVLPKGALVIILHTCEFPQGNTWAKRITKEAIKVLSAEDEVGAIGYGIGGDEWIFELTPAKEYELLAKAVNGASIGDMPEFTSSMELGLKGLEASDAASRHMIIISDGDPPMPPPQLIRKFQRSQTTVSTVAVFPHDPRDAQVLNAIATQTKGRFYFPSDPKRLPSIFIKEAKTLRRNQIQNRTFQPELQNDHEMLRSIGQPPNLHGYVLASMKEDPRARIILSAPPAESDMVADDSDLDPVLATWRYGLGATAAYTSDLSNAWGRDWVQWKQFQKLVSQMTSSVARVKKDQYLRVYTYVNGGEGVVVVEDFHPEETLLDISMTVSSSEDPNREPQPIALRQIGPRRYQATTNLPGQGRYQVKVDARAGDRKEVAYGGFIVSYSPEYLRFESNPIVLKEISEKTGGQSLTFDPDELRTMMQNQNPDAGKELSEQIFNRREPQRSTQSVFDYFLMALAVMIPLDVAIRRVQIDFSWLGRLFSSGSKKESTATMGALLKRKDTVRSGLSMDSKEQAASSPPPVITPTKPTTPNKPRPTPPRPTRAQGDQPKPDGQQQPQQQQPPASDNGTTSRLLAMKRRRDEEQSDN